MNFCRSIIAAELRRSEVAIPWKILRNFCIFWKNNPLVQNFQNTVRKNSPPHQLTCCVQISWNLANRKSVKSCVANLTKKHNFCADRAQNLPGPDPDNVLRVSECSRVHPNRFTFGGVIPKCENAVKTCPKVFAIFGRILASSRIKIH